MEKVKMKAENIKYYVFVAVMYILIFQDFLQNNIKIFRYFDEILALMFIPYFIVYIIKYKKTFKIKKYDFIIVSNLIIIGILGIVSNLKYQYQPFYVAISDFLIFYKFFLVYYLTEIYMRNCSINEKIVKNIKIIILLLFVLSIFNYVFNIWQGDIRLGIKSNKIFYSHQTSFSAVLVFLLAILIRYKKKLINIYVVIIMIMLFSTLRMKAIGFGVLFFILAIYVEKSNKKISIQKLFVIGLILIACSFQHIKYYFITIDDSARAMLLKTSFEIANDHFPLGSGFGTYGSYFSGVKYSPIYKLYGIDHIFGIQPNNTMFLSDSFWPMILGQFGYIAIIAYGVMIFMIFMKIQKSYTPENKNIYVSKLICLLYLLISSTAESAFVNPITIPLAILLAM